MKTVLAMLCLSMFVSGVLANKQRYVVEAADSHALALAKPELPSLAPYTRAAILKKLGPPRAGSVSVERMTGLAELDEFTGGDGRLAIWAARQAQLPLVIVLRKGLFTPQDLAQRLDPAHFERRGAGVYIARLPILVGHDATLHINQKTRALRLSEDSGAFLINDGRLFITDSQVLGWRESAGAPASFRGESDFRPFILSWGGTETYIANSRFRSLGYSESKSYGISISQYTPDMRKRIQRREPTGWIINSHFEDLWFGFYCYEANDVVIVGNEYRNNIVYGIDPHDWSERLIIANNKVSGTRQKHGIIISREVNNSWLFGNSSTENALSGMVLDRQSAHNVVADNELLNNGSDGLTVYESSDNIIWGNTSAGNQAHGFRVRNSAGVRLYNNIAINNRYTGISGDASRLPPGERDLTLDPYDVTLSMVVVGGRLVHNGGGPIDIVRPDSVKLADVELRAPANERGFEIKGVLGEHMHEVLDLMVRQKRAVVIRPSDQVEG